MNHREWIFDDTVQYGGKPKTMWHSKAGLVVCSETNKVIE